MLASVFPSHGHSLVSANTALPSWPVAEKVISQLVSCLPVYPTSVNIMVPLRSKQHVVRPCLKYFSGSCCLWDEVQTPWHDDRALQHPICPTAFHPQRCGPVPAVPNCFTLYLPYLRAFAPAVPSGCHAFRVVSPQTGVFCICLTEFYLCFKSPPRVTPLGRLLHHSWKLSPCLSGPLWLVDSSSLPSDHTGPLILVYSSVCCSQGTLSGNGR